MAAEIKKNLGVDTKMIEGDRGIFDVIVDGDLIFSKYEEDRFPEHEEIISALQKRS